MIVNERSLMWKENFVPGDLDYGGSWSVGGLSSERAWSFSLPEILLCLDLCCSSSVFRSTDHSRRIFDGDGLNTHTLER